MPAVDLLSERELEKLRKDAAAIQAKLALYEASMKQQVAPAGRDDYDDGADVISVGVGDNREARVTGLTLPHPRHNTSSAFDFKPGKYSGDVYVEQYLAQFRFGALSAGWPEEEWGVRLITALDGKARRVITESHLPVGRKPTFDTVEKLLRESFATDASPEVWLTALERRQRHDKESLTELSQAVTELVTKAFPDITITGRQKFAVVYFARALDTQLRQHTLASRPKDLNEALQAALAYENACRVGEQRDGKSKSHIRAAQVDDGGEEPSYDAPAKAGKGRGQGGGKHLLVCQLCSKKGHGAKDCLKGAPVIYERGGAPAQVSGDLHNKVQQLEAQLAKLTSANSGRASHSAAASAATGAYGQRAAGSCYGCGSPDHYIRDCPERSASRAGRGRGNGQGNDQGRGGGVQPLGTGGQ